MLVLAVVTGAVLRCDKGASPSLLNATVPFTPLVECKPVATILDNKPGVNVLPFGVCAITKGPCLPVTPIPWVPGETTIPLPSLYPILTEISILPCLVGGIIKVLNAGQSSLSVDCKTDPNRLAEQAQRELLDYIKSALTLRNLMEFALDAGFGLGKLFAERRAVLALSMADDAFARLSALKLSFNPLSWRIGKLKMGWGFLKKGLKMKIAGKAFGFGAKALGRLGNVAGFASIGYDVYKKDYKGAAANAVGFGAGAVCTAAIGVTGVGIVACAALSVGVSEFTRYAIDNPKKALEIAEFVANPAAAVGRRAATYVYEHRDDIARGAGQAKDFAVDKAGDALNAGRKVAEGAASVAGKVLDGIKPRRIPMPFEL